jgi:hypothetical protein
MIRKQSVSRRFLCGSRNSSTHSTFCFSLDRVLYFLGTLKNSIDELNEKFMTTANVRSQLDKRLRDAFKEIIDGKTVQRSKHELLFGGVDVSNVFVEEMNKKNYLPGDVGNVACDPGKRVPAFYIEETEAYFGWIFWEKFTEGRLRKLFGSAVRNEQGDWLILIPAGSRKIVYANTSLTMEMDIDHPSEQ